MTTSSVLTSLPSAFVITLNNYSAISLSGEEQSKYLQGQVTCDVDSLDEIKLLHGAHCNAKGKMYATFRLFNYQNQHLLFQPKATLTRSLAELKKFGVFAKVDIAQTDQLSYIVVAGDTSPETIQQYFGQIPTQSNPVFVHENKQVIDLSESGSVKQYLVVLPSSEVDAVITDLALPVLPDNTWSLLEINNGIPTMSEQAIEQYVPQMLNVQAIHGISFTKGCYLGQETVARMKYLGKNKRALYHLTGNANKTVTPTSIIEVSMGENWRKGGDVIASYQTDAGDITIQAVLASDIEATATLRIKEDEDSTLSIVPLPYSLTEESND